MRACGAVIVAMLAACGGSPTVPAPDARTGFDYTASVGWDTYEDPEILSMTVAGQVITSSSYVFHRTYDSYTAAASTSVQVEATTGSGTVSFQLVPTDCGHDTYVCGGSDQPACTDLTVESEDWIFFHGVLAVGSGDTPLEFDVDEGHCTFSDGTEASWAA